MNLDRDTLSIVWDYLGFETQLLFRQVDSRMADKEITVDTVYTCKGELAPWSPHRSQFYRQVEDIHRYCEHKEIREAARLYSRVVLPTRGLSCGQFRGHRIANIPNNAYLCRFIECRPNDPFYTVIHEVLCDRVTNPPDKIGFGKHENTPYANLPREYLEWLSDACINVVDQSAARCELQKRGTRPDTLRFKRKRFGV